MSNRRRSVFEASDTDALVDFIQTGVPTHETRDNRLLNRNEADLGSNDTGHSFDDAGVDRKPAPTPPQSFSRTMAKARIQKSIRFRPELIEQFELLIAGLERTGQKPPTIQDAMNDAFLLWLQKHSDRSEGGEE